jgi:hypothetical protein
VKTASLKFCVCVCACATGEASLVVFSTASIPFYVIESDWIYYSFVSFVIIVMNYFRGILSWGNNGVCGGNGRYGTHPKDDGDVVWREPLLCDGVPSLPPVPRIIRFDLLQMQNGGSNEDDDEHLVGLAFVEDNTKDQKTLFEGFMKMEEPDPVEQSIEDVLLSTWSSFPSLSTDEDDNDNDDDNDDDGYNNWNKSPVRSFDDGSSHATSGFDDGRSSSCRTTRSDSKIFHHLFFPLDDDEKQTVQQAASASPPKESSTKELSQGTMTTASTWMASEPEYGEI